MRKIILITFFLSLLLSVSIAYSQTITGWERKVYYETVDRAASLPEGAPGSEYERVAREVADKHGLTYDEIDDIGRRVWVQDLSEREWDIVEEVDDGIAALPKGYTEDQSKRVYEDVAKKYGISISVLYEINMRAWGF